MDSTFTASENGRAWAEIDLKALSYNTSELRAHLKPGCELMAVVKANAYGLGAGMVADRLSGDGVKAFAVATVSEGVELRKHGIEGEILVLGYTRPEDSKFLSDFHLAQLAVDGGYAKALDETGNKIVVHVAVDTGMHRLGIEARNVREIESVFECRNLTVAGVATHLASSDSIRDTDMEATNRQIEKFRATVSALKSSGYDVGKLHIQASYGVINYPDLQYDYARVGIALYGVKSHNGETATSPALRPVLSLRAVIAQVRWIDAGETVSYGGAFKAAAPVKLATVCIGYADGIPRQMSGNGGQCIVQGRLVPIVGRICMDLLMVDVTGIESVRPGDIATLIGADGNAEIRCEDFAEVSGTITNDILCRIGSRLPRIYIE